MPATKKAPRKPTTTAKPVAKRRGLSAAHKRALANGRTMSVTVNRYLSAVNTPKRRGRKVSRATLEERLARGRTVSKTATGLDKAVAAQTVRDLEAKLVALDASHSADITTLEAAFVKVAKKFGEQRGITYPAWRDAGVPAVVLKKAGIACTRG